MQKRDIQQYSKMIVVNTWKSSEMLLFGLFQIGWVACSLLLATWLIVGIAVGYVANLFMSRVPWLSLVTAPFNNFWQNNVASVIRLPDGPKILFYRMVSMVYPTRNQPVLLSLGDLSPQHYDNLVDSRDSVAHQISADEFLNGDSVMHLSYADYRKFIILDSLISGPEGCSDYEARQGMTAEENPNISDTANNIRQSWRTT